MFQKISCYSNLSQKIFTDQHLRFNAYIYIWKKLYLGRKNEEAYPSPFVISVPTFYFPLAIESSSYRDSAHRNLSEGKFRSKFSLVTICLQTDFSVTFAISIGNKIFYLLATSLRHDNSILGRETLRTIFRGEIHFFWKNFLRNARVRYLPPR